jgi:RNA polymerase primary sigma factor
VDKLIPSLTKKLKTPILSLGEEIFLHNKIIDETEDEEERGLARNELIHANLRLVVKITNRYRGCGLDFDDLFSEASLGLCRAVDKWHPDRGAKFSSYAAFWIKQGIRRALSNQSRVVRLPVKKTLDLPKIREAKSNLKHELGRTPSASEISDRSGVPVSVIKTIQKSIVSDPISLDKVISDEDDSSVGDTIADESSLSPSLLAIKGSAKEVLGEVISTLPRREQAIIRQRFGLNKGGEKTLEQVGVQFGITKERVRQIQLKTLKKMRSELEKRSVNNLSSIV